MGYVELLNLLKSYGDRHNGINHVVHGDYESIVDYTTRRDVNYPVLLIESPEHIMTGDGDSIAMVWDVAFTVLENSDPKDNERTREALDNCYIIARQIALRCAIENGVQRFSEIRLYPVTVPSGNDFEKGWRANMMIPAQIDESCRDNTVWSDFV